MEPTKRTHIIALGEPLMEMSASEEGNLDSASLFLSGFGGDASNFAVAASRAGGSVSMLTRLGNDQFGEAFMKLWRNEGIDVSLVERDPMAPTGLYFIARNPAGHDFTYYRAGSAASRMAPEFLPEEAIDRAGLLHVTGVTQGISITACDTALRAMESAKKAGVLVSYDPNYRPTLWSLARARAIIHASMAMADIIFPSMEEAQTMLGVTDPEQALEHYLGICSGIVVLKLGPEGALIASAEKRLRVDPIRVKTLDASGAGDTFAGAFATAYLEGRPLEWCGRFAATASGLSTTGLGCVGPMPGREDILAHMEQSGE